ncbi:phosphoribosylglycinamide formyltransferase [Rubrivirga sp.]|uniref:phosphoribosylglycinamide formyltransferase n=1 Tax=Rubrivirga sp. TaxID=1885344 RepID=UPI003C70AFBF
MRLAFFASGGGSNVGAILDAIDRGDLRAEAVGLVTDRPDTGAAGRARDRAIPVTVVPPAEPAVFAQQILDVLARWETDTVALAGYLRKIPEPVVWAYRHRVLNVHPSLLPAFGGAGMYGKRVHRAVLEYGCRVSGATVHLVDAEFDTGPVILQEPVRVEADDTPESLAARVLEVEHRLFPQALALVADGCVTVEDRLVTISAPLRPDPAIPSAHDPGQGPPFP